MLTGYQQVVLRCEALLLGCLLLGLIARGSWRVCATFLLYVAAVLAADAVVLLSPNHYRWDFWLGTEIVHAVLKLLLVTELGWRIFAKLPGARAATGAALLAVLVATLVAVLEAPAATAPEIVAQTALPPVLQGTAWAFGVVFALMLWFRVPSHPLHRAVLRGLVPYLLVLTVCMDVLRTLGWDVRPAVVYGYTIAYQVVLLYWNAVVWGSQPEPPVAPGVVQALQPWR